MPRKKSINHEKIVEAAKKEFGRYGFKEASMRNIAAEAVKHGFSKEEALHYADTLDAFFMPDWLNVMCVPAENEAKNVG
ncbi:MAG: TetR family transcriptional regulator [Lachnospiraceae bacterium]|nr:TetR family transcriptional regulator [Lachnospiraceae bacterium]